MENYLLTNTKEIGITKIIQNHINFLNHQEKFKEINRHFTDNVEYICNNNTNSTYVDLVERCDKKYSYISAKDGDRFIYSNYLIYNFNSWPIDIRRAPAITIVEKFTDGIRECQIKFYGSEYFF